MAKQSIFKTIQVFGALLAIIGLAGVPDDLKTWAGWLTVVDQDLARWLFVSAAIAILAGPRAWSWARGKFTKARDPAQMARAVARMSKRVYGPPQGRDYRLQFRDFLETLSLLEEVLRDRAGERGLRSLASEAVAVRSLADRCIPDAIPWNELEVHVGRLEEWVRSKNLDP